jgi:hypothetical protein
MKRWARFGLGGACVVAAAIGACGDDDTSGNGGSGGDGPCSAPITCPPCQPLRVLVTDDATGARVEDATVTVEGGDCTSVGGGEHRCQAEPGSRHGGVEAEGYEAGSFSAEVGPPTVDRGCCGACPETVTVDASLTPLGGGAGGGGAGGGGAGGGGAGGAG